MAYIREKLSGRRGAALELAIVFMLVIFAMCSILTIVSIAVRQEDKIRSRRISTENEVDSIGSAFVHAVREREYFPESGYCKAEWSGEYGITHTIKTVNKQPGESGTTTIPDDEYHILTVTDSNGKILLCEVVKSKVMSGNVYSTASIHWSTTEYTVENVHNSYTSPADVKNHLNK